MQPTCFFSKGRRLHPGTVRGRYRLLWHRLLPAGRGRPALQNNKSGRKDRL